MRAVHQQRALRREGCRSERSPPARPDTAASMRALICSSVSIVCYSRRGPTLRGGCQTPGLLGGSRSCSPNSGTGNSLGRCRRSRCRARVGPGQLPARRSCCCSVMNACSSASGRGGQPGMCTSTGMIAVDALEHVVALLERPAGDGAGAHGDDVFRLGHLVVEPHDLRAPSSSSPCRPRSSGPPGAARAGTPRRRTGRGRTGPWTPRSSRWRSRPGQSPAARWSSCGPSCRAPPGSCEDALLAQFAVAVLRPSEVSSVVSLPRQHAFLPGPDQAFDQQQQEDHHGHERAQRTSPRNATANGSRKMVSTSKIRKMIAYR